MVFFNASVANRTCGGGDARSQLRAPARSGLSAVLSRFPCDEGLVQLGRCCRIIGLQVCECTYTLGPEVNE